MNTCSGVRSCRPARLFSFGLLDGLHVRLRRPYVRAASAGFRLERLATVFMNSIGAKQYVGSPARPRWRMRPATDGLAFRYSIFSWTKVFFFGAPRVCRTGCVHKASSK